MSLRINQNVLAIKSHGQLSITAGRLDKSMEKLSSGLRINRAADDAAGLAISEKLRRQIRGLSRATLNAQDGISMVQVAEGAMGEAQANLQRMRELAIQASNDTLTSNDRLEIQKEIVQLKDDLNRIAFNTEFNTKRLLDGSQAALVSSTSKYANGIVQGIAEGGDYLVSLAVVNGGLSQMLRSQTMTNYYDGTLAQGQTQLQSLAQFYDGNGAFAFESPQTLTVTANGRTTEITIDKSTTLGYLGGQLAAAIQGSSGLDMASTKVETITTASTSIAGKGGYLQITSGIVGELGEINISGDNAVLNGLGFASIRDAVNSVVKATAIDGEGNSISQTTNTDRVAGILEGMDVKFSSQAAQIGSIGGLVLGINISTDSTLLISSIGGEVSAQISATISAGTYTMDGLVRILNNRAIATGVSGFEASIVDGELRLQYTPTAVSLTNTFKLTPGAALPLGLTTGNIAGMTTGMRDDSKNVWGYTMYNSTISATSAAFQLTDGHGRVATVSLGLTMSVVSTADMVTYATLYSRAKTEFNTTSAQLTLDQFDNSIAFTAKYLGKLIQDNGTTVDSSIDMAVIGGAAINTQIFDTWGLNSAESDDGAGEKNFRLHVVSNQPQFHIGADKGQIMKIAMGNVSVEALGLENINLTTIAGASKALGTISRALDQISSERSKLGAYQNRLEYAINNLQSMHSNMVSAESRLRDADIAQEMIEFTRNQIVNQSGTAMLAQANLVPQGVLQLLR